MIENKNLLEKGRVVEFLGLAKICDGICELGNTNNCRGSKRSCLNFDASKKDEQ